MLTEEERDQAIERITESLTGLGLLEFSGDVMLLDWSKSTAKDGPKVKFLLTDDNAVAPFEAATIKKGKTAGQLYRVFAIRLDDAPNRPARVFESVDEMNAKWGYGPLAKPFGKQAAALYRVGFFLNPKVMEKVGTDQDYLDWLKAQPCCIPFSRGPITTTPDETLKPFHDGDIVPAHVRRIAAGAGTSIKPPYSAVPMCNAHHTQQHQHGESAVGGKEFLDRQRARHLSRWMAQTVFDMTSMGYVDPEKMRRWAELRGIDHYLPEFYR